jgi:hypothetical protein
MSYKVRLLLFTIYVSLIWLACGIYFLNSFNHKTQLILDASRSGVFDYLAGFLAGGSIVLLLQHGLGVFRVRRYEKRKSLSSRTNDAAPFIPAVAPATTSFVDDLIPTEVKTAAEREALSRILKTGVKVRLHK